MMVNPFFKTLDEVQGKWVVVTGAANGIGFETCRYLLSCGANVIAVDRAFDIGPGHWTEWVDSFGPELHLERHLKCQNIDIRKPEEVNSFWAWVTMFLGGDSVHGLVNSAGVSLVKWFSEITPEEYLNVIHTNLLGTFLMSQGFLRLAELDGSSYKYVVNMGSLGSEQAFRGGAAYVSSKGGLKALTRQTAREYRGKACVVCIQPETLSGPSVISEYVISRLSKTRSEENALAHGCKAISSAEEARGYFRGTADPADWQTCQDIALLTVMCLTPMARPLSGSSLQCLDGRT